ncbi:hypothetical protein BN128_2132 [Cronobacter sakazakii 696]|nr:hypothetical protein BN128_2132 [Cronobacter sakazakii 696]
MNVHRRVRLGKAVLHLAVNHLCARDRQALVDVILIEHDFGFRCAANEVDVEAVGAQRVAKTRRLFTPGVIQRAVIEQRDDRLLAAGGQVVNLEQLMAQRAVVANARDHARHQGVNQLARRRETVDANTAACFLIENDVIEVVAVMPEAELGAHAVVAYRRAEHLRRWRGERRHHALQALCFFGQLCVVLIDREMFRGHHASWGDKNLRRDCRECGRDVQR